MLFSLAQYIDLGDEANSLEGDEARGNASGQPAAGQEGAWVEWEGEEGEDWGDYWEGWANNQSAHAAKLIEYQTAWEWMDVT